MWGMVLSFLLRKPYLGLAVGGLACVLFFLAAFYWKGKADGKSQARAVCEQERAAEAASAAKSRQRIENRTRTLTDVAVIEQLDRSGWLRD